MTPVVARLFRYPDTCMMEASHSVLQITGRGQAGDRVRTVRDEVGGGIGKISPIGEF